MKNIGFFLIVSLFLLFSCSKQSQQRAPDLVIYSAWHPDVLNPLVRMYEQKTHKKIEVVTNQAGILLVKLRIESSATPADILLSSDAGYLWEAQRMELLKPLQSQVLSKNIPASLRSEDNSWFGITQRAVLIVLGKGVNSDAIDKYLNLSDERWHGKVCLLNSTFSDTQSLIAGSIFHQGKEKTLAMLKQWVANLAHSPFMEPMSLADALSDGSCSVALLDSSVVLQKKRQGVLLPYVWPDQESSGAHVNVSGAGILRGANNANEAQAFLEWLTSEEAQAVLVALNAEFPVLSTLQVDELDWSKYQVDQTRLEAIIEKQPQAIKLIRKAGYQ
ncbi:MAG: extracellular solute-binding protein [Cellvibrionales bacterium]|nr:extracellular solute-binding protein [Cellvibrionales bacterium]